MIGKITSLTKSQRVIAYSVRPETTAFDAVVKMDAHEISLVLVVDGGELQGVFSAKDYFNRLVLSGRNAKEALVRDVMTMSVVTVSSSATAAECIQIMATGGFRHLPIVDDGKVVGMITRADLMKHQLAAKQTEVDELIHYIGG